MERATLLAEEEIRPDHLSPEVLQASGAMAGAPAAGSGGMTPGVSLKDAKKQAVEGIEKSYILNALEKSGWNKSEAAKLLDLNYKTLREKIKEYDLQKK